MANDCGRVIRIADQLQHTVYETAMLRKQNPALYAAVKAALEVAEQAVRDLDVEIKAGGVAVGDTK